MRSGGEEGEVIYYWMEATRLQSKGERLGIINTVRLVTIG